MINVKQYQPEEVSQLEWSQTKCDKYDYMIAAFCGAAAGIIDIVFVGSPVDSRLGAFSDTATDELVKKTARLCGWNPRAGKEGNISSAIGFFERNFSVNYDQKTTFEVNGLLSLATINHHYKSLSHSPDPIGLFFSILDQFMGTSSFLSDGQLIRIDVANKESLLRGSNFLSKLFSGFCNWIGHLMSDITGSSGSRGNVGRRGTGIAIPFMELFNLCNFGEYQVGKDRQDLATVMVRVFQDGYDARFGGAMAVPVLMEDLMIRVIWVVRQRYFKKKGWSECIPSKQHADLRIMLIVGNATLCLVDGTDAVIRGALSGGNVVKIILHMNSIAWARLVFLVLRELQIRYGEAITKIILRFNNMILYDLTTPTERVAIQAYYKRMTELDLKLEVLLNEFVEQTEREYQKIFCEIEATFSTRNAPEVQAAHSVELARSCGVNESRIIKSTSDLDDFFMN